VKTPVQIGENFSLPEQMQEALAQKACDLVMPDVERIGGVTGWMRAAAIAQAHRIEMSSHLAPEVSAHLLAVTPTCGWLEYVDWADAVLAGPMRIENGRAIAPARLAWNEDAVSRYRLE
jgi:mandelate racemase